LRAVATNDEIASRDSGWTRVGRSELTSRAPRRYRVMNRLGDDLSIAHDEAVDTVINL
jgi:hypothetical protein